MTSVMLVMTIAQARIFFAMARDGLLPPFFGRVHPRFRTPSTGTVITGVSAAVIGGLFPGGVPGELGAIGTLGAFVTGGSEEHTSELPSRPPLLCRLLPGK